MTKKTHISVKTEVYSCTCEKEYIQLKHFEIAVL